MTNRISFATHPQDAISLSHTLQQNNNAVGRPVKEPLIPVGQKLDGGNVSDRLEKIRTASEGWKKRIGRSIQISIHLTMLRLILIIMFQTIRVAEQSDAGQFTVAGRLAATAKQPVAIQQAVRYDPAAAPPKTVLRSLMPAPLGLAKSPSMMVPASTAMSSSATDDAFNNNGTTTPAAAAANDNESSAARTNNAASLLRSISVPMGGATAASKLIPSGGAKVSIHRPDDEETFASFFASHKSPATNLVASQSHGDGQAESPAAAAAAAIRIEDFDAVRSSSQRLVHKRTVQGPKKSRSSVQANPLKVLAQRADLRNEYTEIRTDVADKELRRMRAGESTSE